MRLDLYLTEHELARSRERAKEMISKGLVTVDGIVRTKPAFSVADNAEVKVNSDGPDYVGRGLLKLEGALKAFDVRVEGRVCADIGASTGGFTQCLLRYGAKLVYAVDVGHDQLDKSLRGDSRVVNMEGVNARSLEPDGFSEPVELMSVDLSFISLSAVMPALVRCLAPEGEMIVLIKPQFEAGKAALNKHGIVRSEKDHVRVLEGVFGMFGSLGLSIMGAVPSPITGGSGNIEYLALVKKGVPAGKRPDPAALVRQAFEKER